MRTVAVIQARMASTRLPGKVMHPLAGKPVLERVVDRVAASKTVDETIIATTDRDPDDVIAWTATEAGAATYRGSEIDVLGRMFAAADSADAGAIVRICADSPLVSASIIDPAVELLASDELDYVSNKLTRTFPLGMDVEVFTMDSFERVERVSTESHEREHVTVWYRDRPDEFARGNVRSADVFEANRHQNRTDLRVTLDEPADYRLLATVFEQTPGHDPSPEAAIDCIDEQGLASLNADVQQKTMYDKEE